MATQVDLGKIRPVWKGTWAATTAYERNDMVREGVNSYICVTAHTSGATFSDANWHVLAYGFDIPDQTGNAGLFLQSDGTNLSWQAAESTGRLLGIQVYTNDPGTSNASKAQRQNGGTWTWTKPSGCNKVLVYCTGAGAGSSANDSSYRGWGGGAGATAIGFFDVSSVSSVTVTTGSGSNATNSAATGPGTGGTSSFGSFCSATGGKGAYDGANSVSPYAGGVGGFATGGQLNLPGGPGQGSHGADVEGGGGASYWYKSGGQHHNGTGQGDTDLTRTRTAGRFGSGGGMNYGSNLTTDWRHGGAGIVVVYEYS